MTPADALELTDVTNDVLQLIPRHRKPITDDVVLKTFHRSTGSGRSFLLTRQDVQALHDWTGRWLAEGWDGVTRKDTAP